VTVIENLGRGPLSKQELAARIARDIPPGSYVNLGIGQPTTVADYVQPEHQVVLHSENGMLGMGRQARADELDPDLINAGKIPVIETPGASYFDHAASFAMTRSGHIDICVLGAFQVSTRGDLANWHTGDPDAIPGVGGAMDLAVGAKQVWVMMTLFNAAGGPKLVPECTYPHTGLACVKRIYTDLAIFSVDGGVTILLETFGISVKEIQERLQINIVSGAAD
jgi:3-oxoadipate CoA-transferase beta subunit